MTNPKSTPVSNLGADPAETEQTDSNPTSASLSRIGSSTANPSADPNNVSKFSGRAMLASGKKNTCSSSFNVRKTNIPLSGIIKSRIAGAPAHNSEAAKALICKKALLLTANDRITPRPCRVREKSNLPPSTAKSVAPAKANSSTPPTSMHAKKTSKTSKPKQPSCRRNKAKSARDPGKQDAACSASNAGTCRPAAKQEVRKLVKILPATKNHTPSTSISSEGFTNPVVSVDKHLVSHSEANVNSSLIENPIFENRPVTGFMTSHTPAVAGSPLRMVNTNIPTNSAANSSKIIASNSFSQRARTSNRVNSNSRGTSVVGGLPNININPSMGRALDSETPPTAIAKFLPTQNQRTSNRCGVQNPGKLNNCVTFCNGTQPNIDFSPHGSSDKSIARQICERSCDPVFMQGTPQVPRDNSAHVLPHGNTDKCVTSAAVPQPDQSHKPASVPMYKQTPVASLMNVSLPSRSRTCNTPNTLIDKTNLQPVPSASLESAGIHPSADSTTDVSTKVIMKPCKDEPMSTMQGNSGDNADKPPSTQQVQACQLDSTSGGDASLSPQASSQAMAKAGDEASSSACLKSKDSQHVAGAVKKETEGGSFSSIQGPPQSESQNKASIGCSSDEENDEILPDAQHLEIEKDEILPDAQDPAIEKDEVLPDAQDPGTEKDEILPNEQDPGIDDFVEVNLPYGRITTIRMTKDDMDRHIPVWNSRLQYKLAGTSAPLGRNLASYLQKKMGEYELYDEQDKEGHNRGINGGARVTLWNKVEMRKISGTSAPLKKNIEKYLKEHPQCEVYKDQAERLPASVRSSLQNQNRVTLWNKVSRRRTGFGSAGPLRKNLRKYLESHPNLEEYKGQDKELEASQAEEDEVMKDQQSDGPDDGGDGQTVQHQDQEQEQERCHPESPCFKRRCDSSAGVQQRQEYQDTSLHSSIPFPKSLCPIDLSHVPDLNQFPIAPTNGAPYPREWYENFYRFTDSSDEDIFMAPHAVLGPNGQNSLKFNGSGLHTPETDMGEFFRQQLAHRRPQTQPENESLLNIEMQPDESPDSPENDGNPFNPDDYLNLDVDIEAVLREEDERANGNAP